LFLQPAFGQELRLEVVPVTHGQVLQLNEPLAPKVATRVTRLDCLLSGLALQKKDGTWRESRDWFAYLSATSGRLTAQGSGIPAGEYTGIRFRIGVDEVTNKSDPHRYAPDDPLNPQVNGLHWGWQGGTFFWRWKAASRMVARSTDSRITSLMRRS